MTVLLVVLSLTNISKAQNKQTNSDTVKVIQKILIGGRVEENYLKLSDVTISMLRNGKVAKKIVTNELGDFIFQLQPDEEYFIEFTKPNYTKKKLYISTKEIPDNLDINWTTGIIIDLFKTDQALNTSALNNPIGKIYYFPDKKSLDYDRDYTKSIQYELDNLQFELNKIREVERRANAQKLAEEKRLQKLKEEEEEKRIKDEELKARVMAQQLENQKKTFKQTKDSVYKVNKSQQLADAKKRYVTESIQKQKSEQLIRQKNDSLMRERVIKKKLDQERQQQILQTLAEKKKHEFEEKAKIDSARFAIIQSAVNQKKEESIQAVIKAKEDNTAYDTKDDRPKINIEELKGLNQNDTIVKINYFDSDSSGIAEESAKANFNRKLSHEEQEKFFAYLLNKYPEGITLEEDVYPGFKIKRIIAKQNNAASEYKIIEFNFGMFYKRNDADITSAIFKKEVKGYDVFFRK